MVIDKDSLQAQAKAAAEGAPLDVASVDWDDLHAAVLMRLRGFLGVDERGTLPGRTGGSLRDGVRECLSALEHLQVSMAHEIDRRRELEATVGGLRTALNQALKELAEARTTAVPARPQAPYRDSSRTELGAPGQAPDG